MSRVRRYCRCRSASTPARRWWPSTWRSAASPAPGDFLEGPFGYFALIDHDWDPAPFAELGRVRRITELSHKPFPSGRATHGGVDGALSLQAGARLRDRGHRGHPGLGAAAGDPARRSRTLAADGGVLRAALPAVRRRNRAAARHGVGRGLRAAGIARPGAARARRAHQRAPRRQPFAERTGAATRRGRPALRASRSMDLPAVLGAPGRPLGRERHLAKFREAAVSGLQPMPAERIEALIAAGRPARAVGRRARARRP